MQWTPPPDTRANMTIAFLVLLASLAVGAVMVWLVWEMTGPILAEAKAMAPGGYGGVEFNDWMTEGNNALPAVFLLAAFFGFIVRAVYGRGAR